MLNHPHKKNAHSRIRAWLFCLTNECKSCGLRTGSWGCRRMVGRQWNTDTRRGSENCDAALVMGSILQFPIHALPLLNQIPQRQYQKWS